MLPVSINIFFLKINVIQTGAAIGVGQNFFPDWTAISKSNSGIGSQYGDASDVDGSNIVFDDSDLTDMPVCQQRRLPVNMGEVK
ncbi:hypothetical protein GFC01_02225 [Desulfofundulus thermobenzoicus]|uniref:Spore germination protein n=1 Tax=Desulfofundulus thermobenzoicus TaxID=29376 RepID=A0A6N7IM95_9FIRM|nr:hypothetical protein [Desulfofundulus thermobenzoicus]MQL51100.1 hypothetical protein [Desulfofundulus thermobenzoicus]HHW42516.1 hypothetical protein [Desulfotomaculum sp.]